MLEQLPKYIVNKHGDKMPILFRYSISLEKWICGYGNPRRLSKQHLEENKIYIGFGDTIEEATNDLLNKIKTWK
jgi:hypothetical protein